MTAENYTYIELLRQVCPYDEPFYDFDYFLLGSFDAMSVATGKSIAELKSMYESKHRTVQSVFDRQPVYLYSKKAVDLEADNIFAADGEKNECTPLVLTLFQLDKVALANETEYNSPDELISGFERIIARRLNTSHIRFQVFWNLGESDIVVVFRTRYLREVSDLLHDLRINGLSKETMYIISTASHCAFPKPSVINEKNARFVDVKQIISKNLHTWLYGNSGFTQPLYDSEEFITLGNVTSYDALPKPSSFKGNVSYSFLFGEWDYMMKFNDLKQLEEHLRDTFMCLVTRNDMLTNLAPFRVSYTIPMFSLELPDPSSNTKRRVRPQVLKRIRTQIRKRFKVQAVNRVFPLLRLSKTNTVKLNEKKEPVYLDQLSASMEQLAETILHENSILDAKRRRDLAGEIQSFRNTLYGMGKFLYRLKIGRFEEDLYTYIQPVFTRLRKITDDYSANFQDYCRKKYFEEADALIIEYLNDTSKLIENLQHLFSVMAVSPHTYMETYGSTMRSLAAGDKLLDAYQGVIEFLKDYFPDTISKERKIWNHTVNYLENCEREILIFPYRKTQAQHNLLYTHSRPLNRISYISLDFSKMFNLNGTVFTLLHECGHHLGDRERKERFKLFFSALVCQVLCWASVDDYIKMPVEYLVRIINHKPDGRHPDGKGSSSKTLFNGLSETDRTELDEYFKRTIRETMFENVQQLGKLVQIENYDSIYGISAEVEYEEDLWKNYYSVQILDYLEKEGIPQFFGFDHEEKNPEYREEFRDDIKHNICEILAKPLGEITKELVNSIEKKGGNIREALRIHTLYSDNEQIVNDLYSPIEEIFNSDWREGSAKRMLSIFSNIYSDLFAIRLLDMEYDDYVKIIPEILGVERVSIDGYKANLFRVYSIVTKKWGKKDLPDFLRHFNSKASQEFAEIWDLFQYAPYLPYTQDYVDICDSSLEKQFEVAKRKDPESINQLKNMLSEQGDMQIKGIYHFYQYLMKKGKQRP